jgi:xanthine dehydrogenase accessory factor
LNVGLDPLWPAFKPRAAILVHDRGRPKARFLREVGAWMAVFAFGEVGTIGGGQSESGRPWPRRAELVQAEWQYCQTLQRVALGPSLGQCCGGAVELQI